MNIKKIMMGAMGVAGFLATMVPALAGGTTLLAPGTTVVPAPATETGSLAASQIFNFTGVSGGGKLLYTGSLTESVFRESTGFLTFGYQVTNNAGSANTLKRLTVSDFTGFTTFVGQAGSAGQTLSLMSDRSAGPGDVVGFNFTLSPNPQPGIPAGGTSALLLVTTNATFFDNSGGASVIDGASVNLRSFEPTSTPEASTVVPFGFVGLGLLGLVAARRKKAHATFA